jgi:hypothetical protein
MITNTTEYTAHKNKRNTVKGHFATVNMESGTQVGLLFTILESDTMKRMPVESLIFSILDMDDGPHNQTEEATLGSFSNYHVTSDTEVSIHENADGTTTFSGTQFGELRDNPSTAETLNPLQKTRAVSFRYDNVSQWRVHLNVTGTDHHTGRNFLFAGESSLMQDCPISVKP